MAENMNFEGTPAGSNGESRERKKRVANLNVTVPALPDVEKSTLSCAFQSEDALHEVTDTLSETAFDDERHKVLFRVLQDLVDRDMAPDLPTAETLRKMRGRGELVTYAGDVFTQGAPTRNVRNYCLLLLEQESKRKLLDASLEALGGIEDPTEDAFELQRSVEEAVMNAFPKVHNLGPQPIEGHGDEVIEDFRRAAENRGVTGLDTGFEEVNKYTHGWQAKKSYVLAAASSMGKTALAVNFVRKLLFRDADPYRVAYFSAENPERDIAEKLLAAECRVNLDKAKEGKLFEKDYQALQEKSRRLDEMPLWVQFDSRLHMKRVSASIRRLVRFEGVEIVFLDNLNKMQTDLERGWNRERELAAMSAEIKGLAEECEIPIVTLAQITRSKAQSGDKPSINHIRGSGMIENDADAVSILYRPEYYGIEHSEELGRSTKGLAELIWAKNRGGKRNVSSWLTYVEEEQRFSNGKPAVDFYEQTHSEAF